MLEKAATYYDSPEMTQHITCSSLARTGRLRFAISQEESGKTILDLGCGPGTQISYLAPRNFVVGAGCLRSRGNAERNRTYVGPI